MYIYIMYICIYLETLSFFLPEAKLCLNLRRKLVKTPDFGKKTEKFKKMPDVC
jgi:hypothetical protein